MFGGAVLRAVGGGVADRDHKTSQEPTSAAIAAVVT